MLPTDSSARKAIPACTGFLDYFPDAVAEVATLSRLGNDQHNPGQPLHWAREKSTDHADCIVRHLLERGTIDTDGVRHSAKVAWRAMALLQTEIEKAREAPLDEDLDMHTSEPSYVVRFGLAIGETVNLKSFPVGEFPGVVTSFPDDKVVVRWSDRIPDALNSPERLRHGK